MEQGGKHSGGFTIVETLIVLAVSSILATGAILLIGGRQNKTEFQTAINQLQQQLQQVINETASGYFPASSSLVCDGTSGTPTFPVPNGSSKGQGTNGSCIFLGKVLQFGIQNGDDEQYIVYPIAGSQQGINTAPSFTVALSNPQAVSALNETKTLANGLTTKAIYYNGDTSLTTGAVGFLAGDANGVITNASGDSVGLSSGTQLISLYAILNTTKATVQGDMETQLNKPAAANYKYVDSVTMCFASGTTQQSGLITIGGGSRQLSVNLVIKDGTVC